jgi:hypothetical protein
MARMNGEVRKGDRREKIVGWNRLDGERNVNASPSAASGFGVLAGV